MIASNTGPGLSQIIESTQMPAWVAPTKNGKTTLLTEWLLVYAHDHPDRKIYANYFIYDGSGYKDQKHLHPQFKPLPNFEFVGTLRKACAVGIDELGSKYVPSHEWTSDQNNLFYEIASNVRKHDVSFGWTDQNRTSVDFRFRNNVDNWQEPVYNHENDTIEVYRYSSERDFETDNPIVRSYMVSRADNPTDTSIWNFPDTPHIVRSYGGLIRIVNEDYDTYRMPTERVKGLWPYFHTKQIIPKVFRFELSEQAAKVKEFLGKEGLELTQKNLNYYQVKNKLNLSAKERDAIEVELTKGFKP